MMTEPVTEILSPRFVITNAVTTAVTGIERARGFPEAAQLSEDWVTEMQDRALILEAHYTTHIEGTQLTLEQSESLLAGRPVSEVTPQDARDVLNYRDAFNLVAGYLNSGNPVTEGFIEIVASTPNDGSYQWTAPSTPSTQCRVKISDAATGTPSDVSDGDFTIVQRWNITVNKAGTGHGTVRSNPGGIDCGSDCSGTDPSTTVTMDADKTCTATFDTIVVTGDANGDGKVNVIDVRICWQFSLGLLSLTADQQAACNVDGDGQVTKADAEKIAQYSIGMITSWASVPRGMALAGLVFPFVFLGDRPLPRSAEKEGNLDYRPTGPDWVPANGLRAWSPPYYPAGTGLAAFQVMGFSFDGTSDLTWGNVVLGDANNAAITTFDLEGGSIVVR